MSSPRDKSSMVEALNYLRACNQFFEFDDQERVVHVAIYDAQNADEIAAHVGRLVDVENLTFSRTDLTDQGLSHWHELARLRELWIGGSGVTAAGLSCLAAMTQLDDLYIEDASHLDRAAFERIAVVASLRRLSLRGGRYSDDDLQPLSALDLEKLSLIENEQISGAFCRHLTKRPRLKKLDPGEYVTDEGLAEIARMPYLETLFLKGPFTDAGLAHLNTLKHLQTLYITSQRITAAGLAVLSDLPALAELGLRGTLSGDASIPALVRFKTLQCATFIESRLSDEGRQQLREALPNCEIDEIGRSE
jgi:hypothetical protein